MPLASLFNLQWYGPGSSAGVLEGLGTVEPTLAGFGKAQGQLTGTGLLTDADATRLVNRPATLIGSGAVTQALPKARGRLLGTISIGSRPTAEDIAQAVWGASKSINAVPNTTVEALRQSSNAAAGSDPAQIADAVWDEATSGHAAPGSFGATLGTPPSDPPPASEIADAVWDESATAHTTPGTFGEKANTAPPAEADIAQAVWDEQAATGDSYGVLMTKLLTVAKFLGLK